MESLVSSALLHVKTMTRGAYSSVSRWRGKGALGPRIGSEGVWSCPPDSYHCPAPCLVATWGCREPSGILRMASDPTHQSPDTTWKWNWRRDKQQQDAGDRPWLGHRDLASVTDFGAGLSHVMGSWTNSQGPVQLKACWAAQPKGPSTATGKVGNWDFYGQCGQ